MVRKIPVVFAFAALLLFAGCLTTKDEADCEALTEKSFLNNLSWGEVSMCYHEVAVGYALKNDSANALAYCGDVNPSGGFVEKSEQNNCYSDIAQILRNETICDNIQTSFAEEPVGDFSVASYNVTKSYLTLCKEKSQPRSVSANLCTSTAFMLAPLLFALYSYYKKEQ